MRVLHTREPHLMEADFRKSFRMKMFVVSCACRSVIPPGLLTLGIFLSHVAVGARQHSWRHPRSSPPLPLRDRSRSSCCCLRCVWCWTWRDPSSPARTHSWSTRWKTVNWWDLQNHSRLPPPPPTALLIELSTQHWPLWLRKSNQIRPKNRRGQCRLMFNDDTAHKKLFVFYFILLSCFCCCEVSAVFV